MELAYPFRLDSAGRAASVDRNPHIRQMIEQVLFTTPGERVNRPDFGCGLLQLVFVPERLQVVGAARLVVQNSLQRWLGDIIRLENVFVTSEDSQLIITIDYVVLETNETQTARFARHIHDR